MSETLRPWLSMGCRQAGIAGNRLMFAGGTTKQHHTCCIVTYPAIYTFKKMGKPKEPTHFSRAGLFSRWPRMALRIMVFLPISTTALPRRNRRMDCICLEPTLSAPTMKHFG